MGTDAFLFRRLEQHRQPAEPSIVDETPKRLESDATLTDVLVTIDAAAERPLRIVQVENLETIDANQSARTA